jgi:hypothetical protein
MKNLMNINNYENLEKCLETTYLLVEPLDRKLPTLADSRNRRETEHGSFLLRRGGVSVAKLVPKEAYCCG